jgi:hypothetical protein
LLSLCGDEIALHASKPKIFVKTPPTEIITALERYASDPCGGVPKALLTSEFIGARNSKGETVLFTAVRNGHINQIPEELLTEDLWIIGDSDGWTPIHEALADGEHIDQIPAKCLTEKVLGFRDGDFPPPIIVAANEGNLDRLPPVALNANILTLEIAEREDEHCCNALTLSAKTGQIDKLPASHVAAAIVCTNWREVRRLWILDEVTARFPEMTRDEITAVTGAFVREAIETGVLTNIPRSFIRPEILRTMDANGWSAYHFAAEFGLLSELPPQMLTIDDLTDCAKGGECPIGIAAARSHIDQIPISLLTTDALQTTDASNTTCAEAIVAQCLPYVKARWDDFPDDVRALFLMHLFAP